MTAHPDVATAAGPPERDRPSPRAYAAASKAEATWRAYRSDWSQWAQWCARRGVDPWDADPEHVAEWAADLAQTVRPSTVGRKVAAMSSVYRMAGRPSPARDDRVRLTLAGIRRTHGAAPAKAAPLTADLLRQVVGQLDPARPADVRDAAVLLVGFALAGGRSELVALEWGDVAFVHGGMRVTIRRGKGDQEAHGVTVGVPTGAHAATCPVGWLRRWQTLTGASDGAVFRPVDRNGRVRDTRLSAQSVRRIVKARCEAVGLDPARYSAHSLRAGYGDVGGVGGASTLRIADHGRWRSLNVLQGYVRDGRALDDGNPLRAAGL